MVRNNNFLGEDFQNFPKILILCDFNGILTGQNIAKKGRANIINKVQTEWSVMKSLRKTAVGSYDRKMRREEPD